MQSAGTYSHHYAYLAHVIKAAAYMPKNSGVLFVATRHFPSVRWYDIDSHLDYSYPAPLLPGVDWLATLTGTLGEYGRYRRRVQHIQTDVLREPIKRPLE